MPQLGQFEQCPWRGQPGRESRRRRWSFVLQDRGAGLVAVALDVVVRGAAFDVRPGIHHVQIFRYAATTTAAMKKTGTVSHSGIFPTVASLASMTAPTDAVRQAMQGSTARDDVACFPINT